MTVSRKGRIGKEKPCHCMEDGNWEIMNALHTNRMLSYFVAMVEVHELCSAASDAIFKNFVRLMASAYEDVSFLNDLQKEIEVDRRLERQDT